MSVEVVAVFVYTIKMITKWVCFCSLVMLGCQNLELVNLGHQFITFVAVCFLFIYLFILYTFLSVLFTFRSVICG